MSPVVDLGNGRQASYEVIGEGRPALMFPGGPGFAAAYLRSDAALLADELKCYLIDPHGSGDSTPPVDSSHYTAEGHATYYEEVRRALGLDEVLLLGHSFGATTALTYSALFPAAVAGCIAVGPFGMGRDVSGRDPAVAEEWEQFLGRHSQAEWYPAARAALDSWEERVVVSDDPHEMDRIFLTAAPLYTAHPERPEVAAALDALDEVVAINPASLKAWAQTWATFDLRPLLGKIGCPTLVVTGDVDYICGPAQCAPIAAGIPGAEYVVIPDCAHLPAIEAPELYRNAVMRFLPSVLIDGRII